jgi:serine/threonine-protein kinase
MPEDDSPKEPQTRPAEAGSAPSVPVRIASVPLLPRQSSAPEIFPGTPPPVSSTPPPTPGAGGPSQDDDPLIGTVLLDRVRILRPIARGGMGKVYLGEQTRLKRPCAIKILDPRMAGANEAEFTRRFLLEASVSAKLTHPNAVTIFDYGETDGRCFIAMEYLEGRTLSEELKRVGRIPAERAIHIARQACRALREAHGLGVVHRDMKPANVFLVKRDDEDDFVKVLDFGLVKETHPAEGSDHTQVGQIMGSPKYMAPEQVQGRAVDARTDVYSVGVMLYAMLAGRSPFEKPTELATMMAQVSDAPPPIGSVAPDAILPEGLEAVVTKCLAKSPDERYSSMEELITALKLQPSAAPTASDSGGQSAPQLSTAAAIALPQPPPQAARNRAAVPVIVGIALVVAAALSFALLSRPEEPNAAAPSTPSVSARLPPPPPAPKPTATLHVDTDPPGARVKEEGETMCESTPCDIVYVGEGADAGFEHLLTFMKADYKLERKIVAIGSPPVTVKLTKAR